MLAGEGTGTEDRSQEFRRGHRTVGGRQKTADGESSTMNESLVRAYCEMGLPQGSEAVKVVSQLAVVFYREAVRDQ